MLNVMLKIVHRLGIRTRRFTKLFMAMLLAAPWMAGTSLANDLVITNARLFSGSDANITEDVTLRVSDGRIDSISATRSVDGVRAQDAVVIDAAGKTILPGLVDAHVHLFFDLQGEAYFPTTDAKARDYVEGRLRDKLADHLEHGFTSVLSPIDFWPQIMAVRERVASGEFKGPRLFVGGGVFVAPGGHYICRGQPDEKRQWCNEHISRPVGNAEQARKGVRQYADSGVDVIVYDSTTNAPALARDVVRALVDEAHGKKLPVLVHGSDAARFNGLMAAGVDGFVHPPGGARHGAESLLSRSDKKEIPIGVTIGETEEAIRKGERSKDEIAAYEQTRSNVLALLSEGALPVYASDIPGAAPRDTMPVVLRSLVDLGLTNAEILQASTRQPAQAVLGRPDLGVLAPGKIADILIVDGNPLDDLDALQDVVMVIKDGEVVVDNR